MSMKPNYVPQPPPKFDAPKRRQLIFKQWTRGAPTYDSTRNAKANPNRSYNYITAEDIFRNRGRI